MNSDQLKKWMEYRETSVTEHYVAVDKNEVVQIFSVWRVKSNDGQLVKDIMCFQSLQPTGFVYYFADFNGWHENVDAFLRDVRYLESEVDFEYWPEPLKTAYKVASDIYEV